MNKKILAILCASCMALGASAQDFDDEFELPADNDSGISFNIGTDITSAYVWRGQLLLKGANFQPYLDFNAGNFTLGLWNCTDFDGNLKEFDIYASYTVADQLTFSITDYFTQDGLNDPMYEPIPYGNYYAHETAHAFEFSVDWESNFGLDASMNVLFYGDDKKDWLDEEDENYGKNAYGTYFELGYTASVKTVDFRPFVGMVFNPSTWYGDGTGFHKGVNVVNLGVSASHDIELTQKFKLPIYVAFGYNPQSDDVAAFAGFQIGF